MDGMQEDNDSYDNNLANLQGIDTSHYKAFEEKVNYKIIE